MGSVKDLEIVKKPIKTRMGVGRFHFSDCVRKLFDVPSLAEIMRKYKGYVGDEV